MIDFLHAAVALLGLALLLVVLVIAWLVFFAGLGAFILMTINDYKNPPTEE